MGDTIKHSKPLTQKRVHQSPIKTEKQHPSRTAADVPGENGDGVAKLKWIHLRYFPPGLILQCANDSTMKRIDLLDFDDGSNVDETARRLVITQPLLASSHKPMLTDCLQRLQKRCKPNFGKQFYLCRSFKTHPLPILCSCFNKDGTK